MERAPSSQRGYDAKWRRTRSRYLRDHPYCECDRCSQLPPGKRDPAEVVHHIDGKGPLGARGHDPANLQAMSKKHHDQHTARHQPGGWHTAPRKRPRNEQHPGLR